MPDDSANPTTQDNSTTTPPADDFVASAAPAPDAPVASGPTTTDITSTPAPAPTSDPTIPMPVDTDPIDPTPAAPAPVEATSNQQMYIDIANKISESHNILIALSSDPSVDEMAAAIGLSLFLDKLGKRATAIYSGATPNALEFLKPEETFESTADVLQDFVIALNKEKADHLRYKLDGDYVKIYITPYKAKISTEDLEFSYGDFNVDLVLALDITNGIDLDSALREHGRIMHDAVIINLTTGNPGKFGEIEWSDKKASSVSEMVAKLLYSIKSDVKVGKEEATAFLTGIVAATNRFSKANTTPETMEISSKLMSSGANQQLISKNITPDVENEMLTMLNMSDGGEGANDSFDNKDLSGNDPSDLSIEHSKEEKEEKPEENKKTNDEAPVKDSTLLDDLKAAEASLAQTGSETTPDTSNQPVRLNDVEPKPELGTEPKPGAELPHPYLPEDKPDKVNGEEVAPTTDLPGSVPSSATPDFISNNPEKIIEPPSGFSASIPEEESDKYGRMLEEALSDISTPGGTTTLNDNPAIASDPTTASEPVAMGNPATASTPEVSSEPEINGVPEMNFMPPAGENILPPPPAPPIDMSAGSLDASLPTPSVETPVAPTAPVAPAAPTTPAVPEIPAVDPAVTSAPVAPQPAAEAPAPQSTDASAFKIPGM